MLPSKTIMARMRDGVGLATDIYLPEGRGPWPCLLERTPYDRKRFAEDPLYSLFEEWIRAGYAIAVQDCRGSGDSEGVFRLNGQNEHEDGYDAVEYLAAEPWCNGRIGMFGLSYHGFTQLAAAAQCPPHLVCLTPFMTLTQEPFGASRMQTLNTGHLFWAYSQTLEHPANYLPNPDTRDAVSAKMREYLPQLDKLCLLRPADQNPAALLPDSPLLQDYLLLVRGMEKKDFWESIKCPLDLSHMKAASFHCTGWLDVACDATIKNYETAVEHAPSSEDTWLLIGPWTHGGVMPAKIDDTDFGEENSGEGQKIYEQLLRFFDAELKQKPESWTGPHVRYFVTGSNEWRSSDTWPPKAEIVSIRLTPEGRLEKNPDAADEKSSDKEIVLTADPEKPLPSSFTDQKGRSLLPDWSEYQSRSDMLTFFGKPLEKAVTIAGEGTLEISFIPDTEDLDLVLRLLDCSEDGTMRQISADLLRMRHRNGMFTDDLLKPGETYRIRMTSGNFAHCLLPGHRLAVQLCGSAYPKHDVNPNIAGPALLQKDCRIAHTRLLFNRRHPAVLKLPVFDD